MIPHFSKRTPQPLLEDPQVAFPSFGLHSTFTVNARVCEMAISPDGASWVLNYGKLRSSGSMGESFQHPEVSVRTWSREQVRSVSETLGLGERELLKFVCTGEQVSMFLRELDAARDAASGAGPFPINLYRTPEAAQSGAPTRDIPEEADVLHRFELHAADPLLLHARFAFRGAELIVLGSGRVFGTSEFQIHEDGPYWDCLKFPGSTSEAASSDGSPGADNVIERRKVA